MLNKYIQYTFCDEDNREIAIVSKNIPVEVSRSYARIS